MQRATANDSQEVAGARLPRGLIKASPPHLGLDTVLTNNNCSLRIIMVYFLFKITIKN